MALGALVMIACGSVREHERLVQSTGQTLSAYVGGTILTIEKTEDLPNAFGSRDIWGGKRAKGSVELKYLGSTESDKVKLRVLSTDIETNENWRRRLNRSGYATSSTDAVDFEHDPTQPFEMEGYRVVFVEIRDSSLTYRLVRTGAP
jgi:hypothetical protein